MKWIVTKRKIGRTAIALMNHVPEKEPVANA